MVKKNIVNNELFYTDVINLPQEDLNWCTVNLSEIIKNGVRFEASFFNIEGRHAWETLRKCKWELSTISGDKGLSNAYQPPRFKRIWVEKSPFPIYQPSQISEIYPKPRLYISEKTNTDFEKLKARWGQILLTRSGTIGNCTIVTKTLKDKIFSDDLIRINCKNEVDIGYLYAFLKTKIGNILINTNNYGAVILHIDPEHLNNIPIPNPPTMIKKRIHNLVLSSFDLRDESNDLLDKAEELLIKELELPSIDILKSISNNKNELSSFIVKLSELSNRLEASYHVPIVNEILKHLQEHAAEITDIGDKRISTKVILPARFKRVYVKEGQGTVFFGSKQIGELDPCNKKYLATKYHKKRIQNELSLVQNMILITRSGTIGEVAIVPKHWENWIINEHVIRILPASNEIAGYLYIFLSSPYGYELIKRFTYGSVVDEIDDNHVARIQIPLLKNKTIQDEINSLALEANQKRYEAYVLEQKALKMINEEVIYKKR